MAPRRPSGAKLGRKVREAQIIKPPRTNQNQLRVCWMERLQIRQMTRVPPYSSDWMRRFFRLRRMYFFASCSARRPSTSSLAERSSFSLTCKISQMLCKSVMSG